MYKKKYEVLIAFHTFRCIDGQGDIIFHIIIHYTLHYIFIAEYLHVMKFGVLK